MGNRYGRVAYDLSANGSTLHLCSLNDLLSRTKVTDQGMRQLTNLSKLETLNLKDTQISDLSPLVDLENVVIILRKSQSPAIPPKLKQRVLRS